ADGDAGRVLAMEAGFREVDDLRRPVERLQFEGVHEVQPRPLRLGPVGVLVRERRAVAAGVPLLAADRAGMAADADVEVDDEAELLLGAVGEGGHVPDPPDIAALSIFSARRYASRLETSVQYARKESLSGRVPNCMPQP